MGLLYKGVASIEGCVYSLFSINNLRSLDIMNVQHFLYCTALHFFCVIEVVCLLTSCNDDANYNIHSHQAQVSFLEKDVSVEIEECPEEYEICVGE